jgi:hypothetical protein
MGLSAKGIERGIFVPHCTPSSGARVLQKRCNRPVVIDCASARVYTYVAMAASSAADAL